MNFDWTWWTRWTTWARTRNSNANDEMKGNTNRFCNRAIKMDWWTTKDRTYLSGEKSPVHAYKRLLNFSSLFCEWRKWIVCILFLSNEHRTHNNNEESQANESSSEAKKAKKKWFARWMVISMQKKSKPFRIINCSIFSSYAVRYKQNNILWSTTTTLRRPTIE